MKWQRFQNNSIAGWHTENVVTAEGSGKWQILRSSPSPEGQYILCFLVTTNLNGGRSIDTTHRKVFKSIHAAKQYVVKQQQA